MKTLLSYVLLLSALLLGITSCKEGIDVEDPTLELSASTLAFPTEGGEQTITIETNKTSWTAFSAEESSWLKLTEADRLLRIQASANDQGQERHSVIVVNAGGLQKKITVRQSPASLLIELESEEILLPDVGGKRKISFRANTPQVKVELANKAPWLHIDQVKATSFTLSADLNKSKLPRSAKIHLVAGETVQELAVRQEGIPYYVMPVLNYPAPLEVVSEAELARHHALLQLPDGERNKTQYSFKTRSEVMPSIVYEYISSRSFSYLSATSFCFGRENVENNPEFESFMRDNGFALQSDLTYGATRVYWNESLASEATVSVIPTGARIVWTYYPKQDKAYPTFTRLPMQEQFAFVGDRDLGIHGKTRDEVRAKELKEWGSTLKQEGPNSSYDIFELTKPFDGELFRSYYYVVPDGVWIEPGDEYEDEVSGGQAYFENLSLVFFRDKYGHFFPTQEVKRFFARHGYPFIKKLPTDGAYVYYDAKSQRAYVCNITGAEINRKKMLLLYIQIYLADLPIAPASLGKTPNDPTALARWEKQLEDKLTKLSRPVPPLR